MAAAPPPLHVRRWCQVSTSHKEPLRAHRSPGLHWNVTSRHDLAASHKCDGHIKGHRKEGGEGDPSKKQIVETAFLIFHYRSVYYGMITALMKTVFLYQTFYYTDQLFFCYLMFSCETEISVFLKDNIFIINFFF